MTDNIVIASFPFSVVDQLRRRITLEYRNNRDYDYAFANFAVVPYCLHYWATYGLRLDEEFVHDLWLVRASKRLGHESGEKHRARKLILDAFRAVYDMAAISQFSNVQVRYSAADDMAGRDLQLMIPGQPSWVQLFVDVTGRRQYLPIKLHRRQLRGVATIDVFHLAASVSDLADDPYQPYVPSQQWYSQVVDKVVNYVDEPEVW